MHANTIKARANCARILSIATRNIAEVGFAHATRARIMEGTGLASGSLSPTSPPECAPVGGQGGAI